jgi:hypothetical protein
MVEMKSYLPDRHVNTCMFSATFPYSVMRAAREFIREPEFITLSSDHVHVTEVEHVYYKVARYGQRPQPGAPDRGGKSRECPHLLQHQGPRTLRDGGVAALRLRCG